MISFIIPAYNEEALIGRTLSALHGAAKAMDQPYEAIVADDASSDRTAEISREQGARVIPLHCRQIAAARNGGARAARGDILIFVDADTMVTRRVLRAAVRALHGGAVGGGCSIRFDGPVPPYAVMVERVLRLISQPIGLAGGCFLFCSRRSYESAGGFDESLYAGEEVSFAQRMRRRGRFVILREHVFTSGRKVRTHTAGDLLRIGARIALSGMTALRRREGLELWYGPRGAGP